MDLHLSGCNHVDLQSEQGAPRAWPLQGQHASGLEARGSLEGSERVANERDELVGHVGEEFEAHEPLSRDQVLDQVASVPARHGGSQREPLHLDGADEECEQRAQVVG